MAGTCKCGNEPSGSINAGNFLTSWEPVSFPRRTLLHGVSKSRYNRPENLIKYASTSYYGARF